MKILAFALILFVYNARAGVIDTDCSGVIVRNINHEKEVLRYIDNSPSELVIDYNTNTLFFSFNNVNGSKLHSAYLNLKTGEFNIIEGIINGFANAVDTKTNTVYLGGSDGIYKFDYETKQAVHIDGTSHNIWELFYKKYLYYITYPDKALYIFKDGKSERVSQLKDTNVRHIGIDNNDNIYFSNSSGVYVYKKVNDYISYLGDYEVNDFASDFNGNVYFSTPSGIYSIDEKNSEVQQIASMSDVYEIAIAHDESIIIGDFDNIYRLVSTKKQCFNQ